MAAIDFGKIFGEFFTGSNSTSAVKQVYDIIPTFSQQQLNVLVAYQYYAEKYELENVFKFIEKVVELQAKNKNISFFQGNTATKLLRAYTVDDMLGRIKPQVAHVEEQNRG